MNAFDKIASKPSVTSKKKSKVKVAAEVTEEVKDAVDTFISNKAEIKRLTSEQKEVEDTILDHVRPQHDEMGFCGSYEKSMTVQGHKSALTFVVSDKFSVPQTDAEIAALKKLTGKKFEEFFSTSRNIAIKKEVLDDEKMLNKVAKACEAAGLSIGEIFDVGDRIVANEGLDEMQFELPKTKLDVFRTLVKQAKPALR